MLCYADDIKVYKLINSLEDCHCLQTSVNWFYMWCVRNNMTLSIDKCYCISFTRKLCPLKYDYKPTFHDNYLNTLNKANKMLGFLIRQANEFTDPMCLKAKYAAIIRPTLEFNSVTWIPNSRV